MVIDSSALIAILLGEDERVAFIEIIEKSDRRLTSPLVLVECSIVLENRLGPRAVRRFGELVNMLGIEVVPIDQATAMEAVTAYSRFGKGRHPAKLNLADSLVYALARITGEPLLFKGADFAQTDIPEVVH